jgi:hypothetical protein
MPPELHSGKFALARPLAGLARPCRSLRFVIPFRLTYKAFSAFHLVLSIEDLPTMRHIYDVLTLERCDGAYAMQLSPA